MAKWLTLLLGVVLLIGCASNQEDPGQRALNDEEFLSLSANNTRLIDLYKGRLKEEEDSLTRMKLAKVYLDVGDNESALFTLSSLINSKQATSETFYLQGLGQYNLGQLRQSDQSLQIAINKDGKSAKAINMLGVVKAELGDLTEARKLFDQARVMMYDDLVIKNNLALLDMLEGKYQDAAVKLMPIYLSNPDRADPKLKANLAIILAKMGSFETLRRIYGAKYSDAQLFDIYNDLKASEPASSVYGAPAVKSTMQAPVNLPTKSSSNASSSTLESTTTSITDSQKVLAEYDKALEAKAKADAIPKRSWFSRLFAQDEPVKAASKAKKTHNFVPLMPYSIAPNSGFNIPIAQLAPISVTPKSTVKTANATVSK